MRRSETRDMSVTEAAPCIFCRIGKGEIPAEKVFESENMVAFRDLNPVAPVHVLLIPRAHVVSLSELSRSDSYGLSTAEIFSAADEIARKLEIADSGYRVVLNQGVDAGQEVAHIHFHILGGRKLGWPPG